MNSIRRDPNDENVSFQDFDEALNKILPSNTEKDLKAYNDVTITD